MKLMSKRTIIYFFMLALLVVAIEVKKSQIKSERARSVESVLSILLEKGAPVEVKTIEKTSIEDTFKSDTV
ncbi:MAG: hypothetical protein R2827_02295 [Bdellovibrionales bacterium]